MVEEISVETKILPPPYPKKSKVNMIFGAQNNTDLKKNLFFSASEKRDFDPPPPQKLCGDYDFWRSKLYRAQKYTLHIYSLRCLFVALFYERK